MLLVISLESDDRPYETIQLARAMKVSMQLQLRVFAGARLCRRGAYDANSNFFSFFYSHDEDRASFNATDTIHGVKSGVLQISNSVIFAQNRKVHRDCLTREAILRNCETDERGFSIVLLDASTTHGRSFMPPQTSASLLASSAPLLLSGRDVNKRGYPNDARDNREAKAISIGLLGKCLNLGSPPRKYDDEV